MNKWIWITGGCLFALFLILLISFSGPEFAEPNSQTGPAPQTAITLATTTSTYDSGLLDELLPAFENQYNRQINVKVVAVGTGQALQLGKDGNADVLLVHARDLEDEFMKQGYGEKAYDLMYNQFKLVGPAADPANIREAGSAVEAFQRIADHKSLFISRGDESGTHHRELQIWAETETPHPQGDWYKSVGQGMGATMQMAGEMQAYTLVDEATYLTEPYGLDILFEGDQALYNPYGIMVVKSTLSPEWADRLVEFMVGKEGQDIIRTFGQESFGSPIFVPDVKQRSYN